MVGEVDVGQAGAEDGGPRIHGGRRRRVDLRLGLWGGDGDHVDRRRVKMLPKRDQGKEINLERGCEERGGEKSVLNMEGKWGRGLGMK